MPDLRQRRLLSAKDETAHALRKAVTDAERTITYEPDRRPEVAGLLQIGASCEGTTPTPPRSR